MRSTFVAIAVAVVMVLSTVTASAHTQEEYDAWVELWSEDVFAEGGLTMSALGELHDWQERHPCLAAYCAPAPVTRVTAEKTSSKPYTGSAEQWRGLVATYFNAGDVDWALRIIQCESGGNPNAKNPGSSASGLFQHLARFWGQRSADAGWGGADIFDPEANVAVAAWLYGWGGPGHWVCKG